MFRSHPNTDSEDEADPSPFPNGSSGPAHSPTDTVRSLRRHMNGRTNGSVSRDNRSTWKTLRDFVDEHAVEEVLDRIESDRNELDVSSFFSSGTTILSVSYQLRIFWHELWIIRSLCPRLFPL